MSGGLRDGMEYYVIGEHKEDEEDRFSYYGGASVPFTWESRPGTPKHNHFPDCAFHPPLTPPPSFYSSGVLSTPKRQSKVRTKLTRILSLSLFHDLRKSSSHSSKKTTNNNAYGSSFSWSSTSSSSSFSSSPPHSSKKPVRRGEKSLAKCGHDEVRSSSPTSTLCYSNNGIKGFSSSMESMKRALFSVPRHGSSGKALIVNDKNKA